MLEQDIKMIVTSFLKESEQLELNGSWEPFICSFLFSAVSIGKRFGIIRGQSSIIYYQHVIMINGIFFFYYRATNEPPKFLSRLVCYKLLKYTIPKDF